MKFFWLDGSVQEINLSKYYPTSAPKSSLHLKARELLKQIYPYDVMMEELLIPGSNNLHLDFFLPRRNLAIEVQGEQHYKFNSHFFKNKLEFLQAQKRDRQKREWTKLNNIEFIELIFSETEEQWNKKLNQKVTTK